VSIVIGLALLAFILGDLFRSSNSITAKSRSEVAEIAGKTVSIQEYQAKVDENIENYKSNSGQTSLDQSMIEDIREQTWKQMVHEYVMSNAYEELGIAISGEELFDMVQGNNIDPQIMQIPIFKNQQTGQFDRNLVIQFLKNMELDPSGKAKSSWAAFEHALVEQKVDQKYNTLIEKGLYVTNVQVKRDTEAKNNQVDFDYIALAYNTVSDSVISINQDELLAYYKENIDKYQQKESRTVNYVTFPVIPSQDDDKQTKEWVEKLKDEFAEIENNEQYVNLNSDVPFVDKYYAKDELPESIRNLYDVKPETLYGPYKEDNAYKITKVVEFRNIPDSVKARHILIKPQQGVDAKTLADSLLELVKNGGDFAELAKKYSDDGSAPEGGDLGWFSEGQMVKSFSDSCFLGKKGDKFIVYSQYGAHVVEIINQSKTTKKVKIATVTRTIEPSTRTYQAVYAKASKFGGTNRTFTAFRDAADKKGYTIRTASVKRDDKKIANLENPRQIIRWAYEAEEGSVSDIFELGDMFVVAALKSVQEEGDAPFASVSVDVEREVKKDKKAEYLTKKISDAQQGTNTIQAVADKLNIPIKEAKNVTFAAYAIPGMGYEPNVQAYAVELPVDKISSPIKGNRGVYTVMVKNIQKNKNTNLANDKNILLRSYRSRVGYQLYDAIKEASEIVDNRTRFY
jgi:peptidyl-prolyl cis-trans isomerase D